MLTRRRQPRLAKRLAMQMIDTSPEERKSQVDFLSSGSTNLNLALSGKSNGGWARGRVLNLVGDGSSGKTLEALELAFWCWLNIKRIRPKNFSKVKRVKIVYNNAEEFLDFPVPKMYGDKFYEAVDWRHVSTPEAATRDVAREIKHLKDGEFLLYIIDSWDALQPEDEKKKFEASMKSDAEMKGAQLGRKAVAAQTFFKWLVGQIEGKDATIMVISQVRDIIGATYGPKKKRAGGSALDFYTHQVLWLREVEKIKLTRLNHERVIGIRVEGKVKRSKVAKPFRVAEFKILFDMGIDDLGSMVDFLYGTKDKKKIKWNGKKWKKENFIRYIEQKELECQIAEKVTKVWEQIEEATDPTKGRKRRF